MLNPSANVRDALSLEEALDFSKDVKSSVPERWARKRNARSALSSASNTPKRTRRASSKTPKKTPKHDRFIPSRSGTDLANAHLHLKRAASSAKENGSSFSSNTSSPSSAPTSPTRTEFQRALASNLGAGTSRVLSFRNKAPAPAEGYQNNLKVLYSQNKSVFHKSKSSKVNRHISSAPERILDAPDLIDDYYLNLVDWGSNNLLAVALGQTVYLWNAATGAIDELCTTEGEDDYISSVKFVQEGGGYLAVGTNYNETQLWDVESMKQLRRMDGHSARVSSLSWNQHILSSGSRDAAIVHHDVRVASHVVGRLDGTNAHSQEVCGLSWSPDGTTLASGGNDNLLCLWDARGGVAESLGVSGTTFRGGAATPKFRLTEHQAAVKALAWCPWQRNTLASGGGTADRCIKFWNTASGAMLNSVDTGSQVCSLLWSPHEKELVSSHGFSENQLCLWKFPSMVKVKELTGHTARVLHLAASPEGTTVCSAAADETLRFWNLFGPNTKKSKSSSAAGRPSHVAINRNIR